MGQSLGDLHYTLGINDTDLDKQLAAAKAKISAALGGVGGSAGSASSIRLTGEATAANVRYASELQKTATANLSIAKAEAVKAAAMSKSALAAQQLLNAEAQHAGILQRQSLAADRAANSQKRMAEQSAFANKTFLSQGIIASQLSTILGTTFSIYAVGAFIKKLAEVRGEFELQSVALRAITRDKEAADKIFSQVKTLAVQSPFTFAELLRDTKQLAAFSVETDKLFGTLTRLADVSAGLGVDMNRIILAYGQVKAATVLRGQELRQFTEAGIPIIDMLANKFTKLEGTVVSAGDVFKRISEKMVSFKMVDEIFTELTSSGGMFFEMQKKQSETLAGKLANLKDAYMIMLNAMGSGGAEGVLKGGADFLYTLMTNWSKIADIIKVVIASYGAYKAVVLTTNLIEKISLETRIAAIGVMRENIAANITMTAVQVESAASTNLLSGAFTKLGTAMKANWIGLAIAALVGLGMALKNAYDNAHELENALNKIKEEQKGSADAQIIHLEMLTDRLKGVNQGSLERVQIINELNNIASPYLKNLLTEKMSYEEITKALSGTTDAIYENAKAKAYQNASTKVTENLSSGISNAESQIRSALEVIGVKGELSAKIIGKMFGDVKNNPQLTESLTALTDYINETISKTTGKKSALSDPFLGGAMGKSLRDIQGGLQDFADVTGNAKKGIDEVSSSVAIWGKVNEMTYPGIEAIRRATADSVLATENSVGGAKKDIEIRDIKIKGLLEEADAWRTLGQFTKATEAERKAKDLNPLIDDLGRLKKGVEGLQEFQGSGISIGLLFPEQSSIEKVTKTIIEGVQDTEDHYKSLAAAKAGIYTPEEIEKANKIAIAYRAIAEQLLGWREKEKAEKKPKYLLDIEHEIELMKEAKKTYEDYAKVMSQDEAKSRVQIQFPGVPFESESMMARMNILYDTVQKHSDKYSKETGIKIKKDINDTLKGGVIDSFEQFAKDIQEYFSKNKEKFDLYKTILDITGDKDLSMSISFGVDFKDKDIRDILRGQIMDLTKGVMEVSLPKDLTGKFFEDIFSVTELEKKFTPEIIKLLRSSFDQAKAYEQSEYVDRIKRMVEYRKEFGSNEEKKLAIFEEYQRKLDFVEKDGNIKSEAEKATVIANITNARNIAMAEVDAVILASTKMYKDLYSDMEYYSVGRIKKIIADARSVVEQASKQQPNDKGVISVMVDGKNVELTQKQIESLLKKVQEVDSALAKSDPFLKISKGFDLIAEGGDEASQGFQEVVSGIKESVSALSPLSDALSNLGKATENTGMEKFAGDMKDAIDYTGLVLDVVSAIASGKPGEILKATVAMVAKLINAEAEYQLAKRKFLLENIKMQYEYNNLLMAEKLLFLSGTTIFGADELGKVTNAMAQYRDIAEQTKEVANGLMDAEIKTGEEAKKIFGITVGHYSTYGKLMDQYKGLYEDGKLNVEMAKTLVSSDRLTESTKQQIQQLIDLDAQAKQTYDQMTQYLTNVFGGLGQALSDSIVLAFRDGKDASLDFKNSVTSTIEKLTQDLMNSLFLSDYFSKFQTKIETIYTDPKLSKEDVGKQTTNVMADFLDGLSVQAALGTEFLATMQDEAKKRGIDLFQPTSATAGAKSTLQGEIKAVTEDTAQLLGSLLNAVRGDVSNQLIHVKAIEGILTVTGATTSASLAELVKIQDNTFQVMMLLKSVIGSKVDTGLGLRVYTW